MITSMATENYRLLPKWPADLGFQPLTSLRWQTSVYLTATDQQRFSVWTLLSGPHFQVMVGVLIVMLRWGIGYWVTQLLGHVLCIPTHRRPWYPMFSETGGKLKINQRQQYMMTQKQQKSRTNGLSRVELVRRNVVHEIPQLGVCRS